MANVLIRRLLAVLLLVCCGVVSVGASASAAPCPKPDPMDEQTMSADAVFVGTIVDRTERAAEVTYDVAVDDVYKGDIDERATVSSPLRPRACGLPDLRVDDELIFFVTAQGDELSTVADSGTARATNARTSRVEALLGAPTSPVPPEPIEATFTQVADDATSLERLVAPGFALVLVGLLGLVLVAATGRRRA